MEARTIAVLLLLSVAFGCGRIGFEVVPPADAAVGDSAADAFGDANADADAAAPIGTPTIVASATYGGTGADHATAVGIDGEGNVILGGSFAGDVDFGGGPWSASGGSDAFLMSLDASTLAHRWSVPHGGSGTDAISDIDARAGEVLWIGQIEGTADLGTGPIVSRGGDDWIFGARDVATGSLVWLGAAVSPGDDDIGGRISPHPAGRIFTVGSYADPVDIDGELVPSAGSSDIYVHERDAAGDVASPTRSIGGTGRDLSGGLGVTSLGLYVGGTFEGLIRAGADMATSSGGQDGVVVAYDDAGSVRWVRGFGGPLDDRVEETTGHPSGGVVVCGRFQDTADITGMPLVSLGGDDAFAALLDGDGLAVWVWTAGGAGADAFESCVTDDLGNVYGIGQFEDTVDFGDAERTSNGNVDLFVVSIDGAGATRWSLAVGGPSEEEAQDIFADAPGSVWVVGAFQDSIDVGSGPTTSAGGLDGLLLHIVER